MLYRDDARRAVGDGRDLGRERLALRAAPSRPASRTSSSTSSSRARSGARAAQIAEEIDAVGGVLNAFTGKEYTCYYAKVLREHLPLALDLLADIFLHSRFAAEEIDRERTVVLQEISQVEDTPDDYVHDLFNLRFWPGHPLVAPVCGTRRDGAGLRARRTSSTSSPHAIGRTAS